MVRNLAFLSQEKSGLSAEKDGNTWILRSQDPVMKSGPTGVWLAQDDSPGKVRSIGVCVIAFLSPLRGSVNCHFLPTACAVGCILSPLRGYCLSGRSTCKRQRSYGHRLDRDCQLG